MKKLLSILVIAAICSFSAGAEESSMRTSSDEPAPALGEVAGDYSNATTTEVSSVKKKNPERIGLVLSGGGAKGIAHVGVIKALEDNDIPIDYVTGTSMGAIVGSLYSCGWSPEKMMELFTSPDFVDWSTGTINKDNVYYYSEPKPTPQWVGFNFSLKKKESLPAQVIPTSLISPLPMNIEFLRLYGPYTEQCNQNFNNLFVPFRCVASDVYHKHKMVFSKGSLGESVRASMSFPLVFRPIKIDGVLAYDGGIYDNFPVNVMQEDFKPDFIIGVSVSDADTKPIQGDLYSQLEDMIIQNNDYSLPEKSGVKIQVPVLQFGVLQFNKARTIYEIGYQTGLSMVDSIKSRVRARRALSEVTVRREKFAAKTPALEFDSVKVEGLDKYQAGYLKYLFDKGENKPFGMEHAQKAYYQAVTGGTLSDLLPEVEFRPDGKTILTLTATPKRPWSLGVGGWVTTSTNSMLYLTIGHHTLSFNSLDMSLSAWVGQSYWAGDFEAKFGLRSRIPSYFSVSAVASRQKYYDSEVLFYQTKSPTFITESEYFVRTRYVWAMGRTSRGYANLSGGYISDAYFPGSNLNFTDVNRDQTQYAVAVLNVGFDHNTLNNQLYPSLGKQWKADVSASYQWARYCPEGEQIDGGKFKAHALGRVRAEWKQYLKVHPNWRIGYMAEGVGTLGRISQNYTATLLHSPAFQPTPATKNYFNEAFRSENYLAAGVMPIWMPISRFQIRGDFYGFVPVRHLQDRPNMNPVYNGWFKKVEFIGELAGVINFPFASLAIYCNYLSSPKGNWNFGLNFGLYFPAPKLL